MQILKKVKGYKNLAEQHIFYIDNAEMRIIFLENDIFRFRVSFDSKFEEASYSLVKTAWKDDLDEVFKGERQRIEPLKVEVTEEKNKIILKTKTLNVEVFKEPYGIRVKDNNGNILHEDLRGKAVKKDHLGRVYHYSKLNFEQDKYFGFGERTGRLDKLRKRMKNSPKDSIGHDSEKTDCMYKHIPFYIKLNSESKKAIGLFYHNTYESEFDMGSEISGYWDRYSSFQADGGDIDVFFINGPEVSKVIERYTDLTGKTAFPPLYSLGYLGSTMYYVELEKDCDKEIIGFIDKNIKEDIPISGFQLSSGYTVGDNNKRYFFYWNKTRFTNPTLFFDEMHKRGVPVSPNIKPGILLTHPYYQEFKEGEAFIKNADSEDVYVDKWWGGEGSFIDFTSKNGRETWKTFCKKSLIDKGAISIWNDNCEYDSVEDRETVCSYDGKIGTMNQLKAIQPLMMAFSGRSALLESKPNIRPFVINRSGFAGVQRYASTWAGDNMTEWKTLKNNIATVLGMGLSGVAINGCDVGGFYGPNPEAELLVRWTQMGIFQPRFSIHSCNTNNTVTEPWMYKDYTCYIREAIKLRYNLMPYLYSLVKEASEKGTPIMRPLFYEFQDDIDCYNEDINFMFGSSILVANVVEKGAATKKIYLPKGTNWYDYRTRKKYRGGETIEIDVDLNSIPMFIKEEAIIPYIENEYNLLNLKPERMNYIISTNDCIDFTIYNDDGITNNYLKDEFLKKKIVVTRKGDIVSIKIIKEGNYEDSVKVNCFEIINSDRGLYWVKINGEKMTQFIHREKWEEAEEGWYYSNTLGCGLVKIKNREKIDIEASFGKFDLIGMSEEE